MSAAALAFAVSGCGGVNDTNEEPRLTASQVCDSTLDSSASVALKRMGSTEEFTELPGTNDSGEPNAFSLKRASKTIHEKKTRRNQCVVFKAGEKNGRPLIDVDFSAEEHAPTPDPAAGDRNSEQAFYSMGVYAHSNGISSATLYFKCSTQETNSTPYIRASLTSAPGQISAKSTGRDLITTLNAISRAMTKQLDCMSEASLPNQVPAARTD